MRLAGLLAMAAMYLNSDYRWVPDYYNSRPTPNSKKLGKQIARDRRRKRKQKEGE